MPIRIRLEALTRANRYPQGVSGFDVGIYLAQGMWLRRQTGAHATRHPNWRRQNGAHTRRGRSSLCF